VCRRKSGSVIATIIAVTTVLSVFVRDVVAQVEVESKVLKQFIMF